MAPAGRGGRSDWSTVAIRRPPVTVARPASGGSAPVIIRSRVDLPPPLRPTTPIRSVAAMPSDTDSSTEVVP